MSEILIYGQADQATIKQAENCLKEAEHFCLMGDNHKGYGMPVGGVAVYKDKICPAGVGFDIACGNKAVKLDIKYDQIKDQLEDIAEDIWKNISFGIGRKNSVEIEHELFESPVWDMPFFKGNRSLKQKAQNQLGTIGSGNHYVDVFRDEEDFIWIGVHFGSRGLGHTIASHFMQLAGDNTNIMDETPHCLDVGSPEGEAYIAAMNLAGEYAYAGRDWVCQRVSELIGAEIIDEVHNHHNFAWKETHNGEEFYVVRKGATPAFPGQRGFVGSCMEDESVILEGIDSEQSRKSFYSTVHGAGRVMSRVKAKGKVRYRKKFVCGQRDCDFMCDHWPLKPNEPNPKCEKCGSKMRRRRVEEQIFKGEVDFVAVKERMKSKGIILKGAGADESPEVYKKLSEVLKEHEGTIRVLHRLKPLIVCMAGEDEFDPYKD